MEHKLSKLQIILFSVNVLTLIASGYAWYISRRNYYAVKHMFVATSQYSRMRSRTIEEAFGGLFDEFCTQEAITGTGWTREEDENGLRVYKFVVK